MAKAKRILVGLKDLDHAVELTHLACCLGDRNASILLMHVVELPDPTPLDAEIPELDTMAKNIIGAAKKVARRSGMKIETLVIRAHSAGHTLLDTLEEKKIELAVIGYHRSRTIGEILLGTAAQHLTRHASCRLLISVPPRA
jgi:nucleotide-binding universal stress UspA family protein